MGQVGKFMTIPQEFYDKWIEAANVVRPHQAPPTKEQMEDVLNILSPEQQRLILEQFTTNA